jgi:hypothetical protein
MSRPVKLDVRTEEDSWADSDLSDVEDASAIVCVKGTLELDLGRMEKAELGSWDHGRVCGRRMEWEKLTLVP